ncbi:hypothetical protein [Flavobacterium sp. B183]|uniref:TRADD-N-associated membrane domain-containing protein n=1 Tax=Flavobacterium sp. B183 TaxID=907046 RepID=UPI00201EA41C|nr:hypothetical protein [Flavobacterium sp. B183]URC12123.1 hypothetical protein M4I44_18795 [Flavobacterium sp. B183]
MDIFFRFPNALISTFFSAKKNNHKTVLRLLYLGLIFIITGIVIGIFTEILYPKKTDKDLHYLLVNLVLGTVTLGLIMQFIGVILEQNLSNEKNEELIVEQEKMVANHPNEPKLAWDLARIKLESYLNRNISQVRSIFSLSVLVMIVGFGLIIYGSIMVFDDPKNLNGSILVAIAGLIVNFIGATFLIVYKSVMEQAKDFVNVLERINAVGMSVQIIETIKDSHLQLKEETKAELSKKLIDLYSEKR